MLVSSKTFSPNFCRQGFSTHKEQMDREGRLPTPSRASSCPRRSTDVSEGEGAALCLPRAADLALIQQRVPTDRDGCRHHWTGLLLEWLFRHQEETAT